MAETAPTEMFDLECPHCRKPFTAELIEGGSERHRGFKCPHCRLFVAFDAIAEDADADRAL